MANAISRIHPLHARSRRGETMIEFSLAMAFLIPVFLASVSIGLNLMRSIQVTQVGRDTGSMYSRSVDFTLNGNKDILVKMATGLGMTRTGGDGVVILSKVAYVSDDDCTAAGLAGAACGNRGKYVFLQRIYIGNTSLRSSVFGTPLESGIDATTRKIKLPLTDTSAVANNFGTLITLANMGDISYLVETFFKGQAWSLTNSNVGNQIYARAIF